MRNNISITSWVLTDGKEGMESQCLALTEAIRLKPNIKRIVPKLPWSKLPPWLWINPLTALSGEGDQLNAPWPDILVSTGRQSVAPALAIKKASPKTISIQLQNPNFAHRHFDLIIAPEHDRLFGNNVIPTIGALHRVTSERLKIEAKKFSDKFINMPRPLIGVLLGGSNRYFKMNSSAINRFSNLLRTALEKTNGSLIITPSRRTGEKNIRMLRENLSDLPMYIWDGRETNPYYGILGLSDALVVTCDSINMISEACATGKPVHIYHFKGGSKKFIRFHRKISEKNMARCFVGTIENWQYSPPDDFTNALNAIHKKMKKFDH